MRIHLLFFAVYRDITGVSELDLELAEGIDAAGALAGLRASDARFAALPERPVVAINREYAQLHETLRDGDELAFLPPVAGG